VQSTAGGFTGTLTNLAPPTLVITTNYQLWVNTSDSAELCGFFFTNGTLTAGSPVFTNSFGASIFLSSVNSTQGIWNLNFPDNSPDAISDWLLIGATDPSAAQWGANLTVERAACYITNATAFNVVTFSNGICETNQTTTYSPGQTFALLTAGGGNAGIPGFSGTVTNLAPPTVAYSTNTFIQVSGSGLAPVNDNTYETNASFGSAYGYPIYVNASQTEQILFWEAAPFGLQAGQSGWIIATNGYDQNGNTPVYFLSEGVVASPDLATNWLSVLADSGGNLNPNPLNNPRPTVVAVVTISTNWVRPFNIATFINGVCVTNTTGTLPAAALPPSVVTNNQARVNFGALNFFSGYEYGCITNTTPDSIDLYGQPGDSGAANITLHGDPTFPSSEAILWKWSRRGGRDCVYKQVRLW